VITAWSFHATPIAPTLLKLKVARPAGGNRFTIVGESPPKSPAGGVLSTYTDVRIAVEPGDVIGFYSESASDDAECFRSAPGFDLHFGIDEPPGSTAEYLPAALSSQMSISAVLEPTNSFTLGKAKLNKKKGTATLTVNVPNPGELIGAGNGVKVAGAAVISKTVPAAGSVNLKIRAKGKKKRKLNETGKVKVKPKITYTPTGGDPATQSKKLKLKKR
jgi:hypothetical protein